MSAGRRVGPSTMLFTFPGRERRQVQVELLAQLQLSPAAIDDGDGTLFVASTPTGFLVFRQGSKLYGSDVNFAEFSSQPAAYKFALEEAATLAREWFAACEEAARDGGG